MAKVKTVITTCDRHGGQIAEDSEYLHVVVTPGKTKRGRKTQEELDLCESCAADFLKFMDGPTS